MDYWGSVRKLTRTDASERSEGGESVIIKLKNTKLDRGGNEFINYLEYW